MRFLFTINLIIFQVLNLYSQCPCEEVQRDSALLKYKNVISVELISKSKNNRKFDKNQSSPKGILNEFKIFGVFQGEFQIGDTINCLTGNGKEDHGYIFEIGEKYILFYEKYVDRCSPTQKYSYELSLKLQHILNPNIPPQPPPPPGYTSKLWKYESNSNFYWQGLKAEIINENLEHTLITFNSKMDSIGKIPKNSLITIILNDQNHVIQSQVITIKQESEIREISDELKEFIEQNIKFKTIDENCLIDNSKWVYRYE